MTNKEVDVEWLKKTPNWRLKVTPEESRKVQEALFGVGVFWTDRVNDDVLFTNKPGLVRRGDKIFYCEDIELYLEETVCVLKQEEKQMKVDIEIPEGYEIDEDNSTFSRIKFKKVEEVTCWEELEVVEGYYIDNSSSVLEVVSLKTEEPNRNIFATEEQAEASIALAMLSQLVARENKDVDFSKLDLIYCIGIGYHFKLRIYETTTVERFLRFSTKEKAERFAKTHKELLDKAIPLFIK